MNRFRQLAAKMATILLTTVPLLTAAVPLSAQAAEDILSDRLELRICLCFFSECYTMLANGEIDLFGNVSYTPERAELFNFSSYPQGKDTYWLYVNKNQSSLADGDVDAIVAPDLATDYDYLAISSIGYSEFY